ncbi:MAG: chromate transporter, partial [Betaproteobacteria bacterium]|nr:chromate transporter [Betaproteobacteria bacterium]
APLTAITAAVVGVILNLALFFSSHVLWPEGFDGSLDIWSLIIGVGAAVALIRFDIGVIPVIGACALTGLLISMT